MILQLVYAHCYSEMLNSFFYSPTIIFGTVLRYHGTRNKVAPINWLLRFDEKKNDISISAAEIKNKLIKREVFEWVNKSLNEIETERLRV